MGSDASTSASVPGAEVIFLLGAEDDAGTVDNVDVVVTLADGSRWSATLLTLDAIQRLMDRWRETGENLAGDFFQCHDLVILRRPGTAAATDVLRRLVESGEIRNTLVRLEDEDD